MSKVLELFFTMVVVLFYRAVLHACSHLIVVVCSLVMRISDVP